MLSSVRVRPLWLMVGLMVGLAAGMMIGGKLGQFLGGILHPLGSLWLDALTMTVVPLVFGLLVSAVGAASRSAVAGKTTMRALILFGLMLIMATLTAAGLSEGILRLWPVMQGTLQGVSAPLPAPSPGQWYQSIIPPNPIKAAAEMAMVPLVVFALFLGFASARISEDSAESLLKPLRGLVDAMLVIVGWVLAVGPIGIGALAFGAGARLGANVLGTLGQYVVVAAACCLAATLLAYVWATVAGGVSPRRFALAALPAQAVALGTQSSLATLPVMVEAVDGLGVSKRTVAIVLPMAVSLFRAASAGANVAVAVFLAHMHGIPIGPGELLIAATVAVPVSLGAVGLPAQVSFFATIAPVCIAIGVPVTALPLLLAIESIPDLFRTLGNVTSDMAATCVAAHWPDTGRDLKDDG